MKTINIFRPVTILFISIFFSACVEDGDFTIPTLGKDKEYSNLKSLNEIAELYQGSLIEFTEDITTYGYVVSSDKEGNFFKSIFIQNNPENPTIGFEIKINATKLSARYTLGRKIFIKLKDLFLTKNKEGSYQIGIKNNFGNGIDRISVNDYTDFIDRSSEIKALIPLSLNLAELNEKHINTLVKIKDLQSEIKGLQYAAPKPGNSIYSVNRLMTSCKNSEKIMITNSIFSTFNSLLIPDKKGSITGVFNIIEEGKQLTIRTINDVNFTEEYGCYNNPTLVNLAKIKELFTGNETIITENYKIRVIITSDLTKKNISNKNAFAQDNSEGIALSFNDPYNLNLGDEIEITVGGLKLAKQNGLLQLNLANSNILNVKTGILPTPELITLQEALSGNYESKLVKIEEVQFKNNTKNYVGVNSLTSDCMNSLKIIPVTTDATFANNQVSNKKGYVIGIMTQFDEVQIHLRDESDINFSMKNICTSSPGNAGSDNDLFFSEYAEGSSNNKYIEIYNNSNTDVDLSTYKVELYNNGTVNNPKTLELKNLPNTKLAKGDVLVIYNSRAVNIIKNEGDIKSTIAIFNGDDAVVLKKNDIIIDVIGKIGEDPGAGWEVAGITNATKDYTLIRKNTVIKGNTNWLTSAGSNTYNSEWEVKNKDDFSSVGKR